MNRVRVKVCGLTRHEDTRLASDLGADALGFVLWAQSPRAVDAETAEKVGRGVPAFVARVGVFVDPSPAEVRAAIAAGGLDTVQLHGAEASDEFSGLGVPLLKAVAPSSAAEVEAALSISERVTLLVDALDPVRRGGTGQTADWAHAATLAARRPVVLAGGLTARNVGEAITAVRPWAVDVSSGVEASPGVKSPEKLRAFFLAVAAAHGGEA